MGNGAEYGKLLISETDVRAALAAHAPTLVKCAREAWRDWEEHVAPRFPQPLRRTQASVVSNGFFCRAKAAFGSVKGIRIVEECERLLLIVDEKFILRFKLLDDKWRTRNYPTDASNEMDAQAKIDIEGADDLPRVVFGYRVGGMPVRIKDLWILFAIDREPLWKYDAERHEEQRTLPFPNQPPAQPPVQRFRKKGAKKEAEKKADDAKGS